RQGGQAGPATSDLALGRGADQRVAQSLQETGLVHRTPRGSDPLLRCPGQRHHHRPPPGPRGLETLPLGHPSEALSLNASITYWRKLLGSRRLSENGPLIASDYGNPDASVVV